MKIRFGLAMAAPLTILIVTACGGKTVDLGADAVREPAVSVDPNNVVLAALGCGFAGFANANICCNGGSPTSLPTCEAWPDNPFHACPDGWTTYPNAASCCDIEHPATCVTCDESAPAPSPATSIGFSTEEKNELCGPAGAVDGHWGNGVEVNGDLQGVGPCETRCPPGYNGVSPYDAAGCCQYRSDGSESCFGDAVTAVDGGAYDASVDPNFLVQADVREAQPGSGQAAGATQPACTFQCPDGFTNWGAVSDSVAGLCCTTNPTSYGPQCFAVAFPQDIVVVPQSGNTAVFIDAGAQ